VKANAKKVAGSSVAAGRNVKTPAPPKQGTASKRQRLGRRNTEESALEGLKLHFPRATPMQLDAVVDGETVLQRVMTKKREARQKGGKLGPLEWRRLGKEYNLLGDAQQLKVNDGSQPSATLRECMVAARDTDCSKRTRTPLIACLQQVPEANLASIVGLTKHIASLSPRSKASRELSMAMMKMIKRLGCEDKYKEVIVYMEENFDEALNVTARSCRSGSMTVQHWWECYGSIASLLMPSEDVELVLSALPSLTGVSPNLTRLVDSCDTAKSVFKLLHKSSGTGALEVHLKNLFKNAADSNEKVTIKYLEGLSAQADELCIQHRGRNITDRREVEVQCGGLVVEIAVSSVVEEVALRKDVLVKNILLHPDSTVEKMPWDSLLKAPNQLREIDPKVTVDIQRARKLLSRWLCFDDCTYTMAEEVISMKMEELEGIDQSFGVDVQMLEALNGLPGQLMVEDSLLRALPKTAADGVTPSMAKEVISKLKTGTLSRFCSQPAMNLINAGYDACCCVEANKPLPIKSMTSATMVKVRKQCELWCFEPSSRGPLAGEAAAMTKLKKVKDLKDDEVTWDKLLEVDQWNHLLNPQGRIALANLHSKVASGVKGPTYAKARKSEAGSQPAGGSAQKRKAVIADVDSLFS